MIELSTPPSGLGRLVFVADIAPYAKRDCGACYGQGFYVQYLAGSKVYKPCACATRRFRARCSNLVEISGDEFRWKPGKAPSL